MSEENTAVVKDEEREKLWSAYCTEAFLLGQVSMHIEQTQGELSKLEKQREVAMKKARGAAAKHDEYVKQIKPEATP